MIRDAKINDAKEIVLININGWKQTYKDIFPEDFLNKLNPNDEINIEKCRQKIEEYAVYEINNKIVGFIRYGKNRKGYNDTYAEIYAIYVDYNYQKNQVGTKLINYAFSKLKKNYKYALISTLKENSANIFYQKLGGKYIGTCLFKLENNEYVENIYKFKLQ